MTELSFLIDLLLNHKLPKVTKDIVAGRIRKIQQDIDMSKSLGELNEIKRNLPAQISSRDVAQRNPELVPPPMPPIPVEAIAQNAVTAAAVNSRNQAIAESIAGKVNKDTGRPRKF